MYPLSEKRIHSITIPHRREPHRGQPKLGVECLETRNMLAGDTLIASNRDGQLYIVDLADSSVTLYGDVSETSTEIVCGASEVCYSQVSGIQGPFIHPFDSNTSYALGPFFNDGRIFNGLEYIGNTLYGASAGDSDFDSILSILNPANGLSTAIGPTGQGPIAGLAYDSSSGVMYGIAGAGSPAQLYTIDLATGAATPIGSTGIQAGSLVITPDGQLIAGGTGVSAGQLHRINPVNGESALLFNTGIGNVTGLTYAQQPVFELAVDAASSASPIVLDIPGDGLIGTFDYYGLRLISFDDADVATPLDSFSVGVNVVDFPDLAPDPLDLFILTGSPGPGSSVAPVEVSDFISGDSFLPDDDSTVTRFSGYLKVETPGTYQFSVIHDDGAILTIGGQEIMRWNAVTDAHVMHRALTFPVAGYYSLDLRQFDWVDEADLVLKWMPPGAVSLELIPTDNLFTEIVPEVVDVRVSNGSWIIDPTSLVNEFDESRPLSWLNVNRIEIQFNKDIDVQRDSLEVLGVNQRQYDVGSFAYDASTFTATWTLPGPIGNDRVRLIVHGETSDSQPVDGAPGEGGELLARGQDFEVRFNVLPGDVNGDQITSVTDLVNVVNRVGASRTSENYNRSFDLNGDGTISVTDLVNSAARVVSQLPTSSSRLTPPADAELPQATEKIDDVIDDVASAVADELADLLATAEKDEATEHVASNDIGRAVPMARTSMNRGRR